MNYREFKEEFNKKSPNENIQFVRDVKNRTFMIRFILEAVDVLEKDELLELITLIAGKDIELYKLLCLEVKKELKERNKLEEMKIKLVMICKKFAYEIGLGLLSIKRAAGIIQHISKNKPSIFEIGKTKICMGETDYPQPMSFQFLFRYKDMEMLYVRKNYRGIKNNYGYVFYLFNGEYYFTKSAKGIFSKIIAFRKAIKFYDENYDRLREEGIKKGFIKK
jgi:hypothetical protein